jgi:hypothetical protein
MQMADNGEITRTPSEPEVTRVRGVDDALSRPAASLASRAAPQDADLGGESPCFAHLLGCDHDLRPPASAQTTPYDETTGSGITGG